jgi:hypothetical protein
MNKCTQRSSARSKAEDSKLRSNSYLPTAGLLVANEAVLFGVAGIHSRPPESHPNQTESSHESDTAGAGRHEGVRLDLTALPRSELGEGSRWALPSPRYCAKH